MPPGPFHRQKANANPLRKSTPLRRAGLGANGSGSGPARRPITASGSSGASSKAPSALPGASKESNSNLSNYQEFSLRCTTLEEVKDLRHHIMKFHSRTHIDPAKTFTAPVRLHRKDPRNMQNQLTLAELEERRKRGIPDDQMDVDVKEEGSEVKTEGADGKEDDKKKNGDDKGKSPAEQVDISLIAPDGGARRSKVNPFQKKTRQVVLGDENARKLRYEEHYPWVMEDFEGKNTWVGNYEAGQADSYVLFMFDANGFKMVPAEKYYKMTPRNKYQTLSAEEAEKRMQKGEQQNRWAMRYFTDKEQKSTPNMRRRFRTTDNTVREEDPIRRDEEQDEIDFDEEFADDEEAPIMEGNEEEVKEVEKKVKKELRNDSTDALFEESENEDSKMDKAGLKLIKSLRSLEKNGNYDSDEDINPYATEEESSMSESEEEVAVKEEDKDKDEANKAASGSAPSQPDIKKEIKEKKLKKEKLKNKKKKRANLPPGMVILSLPSNVLTDFPSSVWNPNLKRRRVEEGDLEGHKPKTKKIKIKSEPTESTDPAPAAAATASAATAAAPVVAKSPSPPPQVKQKSPSASLSPNPEPTDADLLTEEDVVSIIRAEKVTAKQLLRILKPKLRKHPNNNALLKTLVSKVAKLADGFLVMKDQQ